MLAGEPDDPAVADHVVRLLEDAAYLQRCSEAARELAEQRYSADDMVGRYATLYERLG